MDEGHGSQADCPDLFIPDFTRAKAFIENDRWPGNEEFTLTLTDQSGKRLAFAANVLREIFLLSAGNMVLKISVIKLYIDSFLSRGVLANMKYL